MDLRLQFQGAARNVTGSRYLVEANGLNLMVDCGLYQERELQERNWEKFPLHPSSLDAVLLTHAHLDHCGLLPVLVKQGFRGRIYCTSATGDIADIVMRDAGKIQEEDAEFKLARHEREGRKGKHPEQALYTADDAARVRHQFETVRHRVPVKLGAGVEAVFIEAGHILGACSIRLDVQQGGQTTRVVFSGDIGRHGAPILRDPETFEEADWMVVESTYGDREHPQEDAVEAQLEKVVLETLQAGGNLVIPAFAVERSQDLLYHLAHLRHANRIPHLMTFLDSPMAVSVTDVFKRHLDLFDEESRARLQQGRHPCDFPGLVLSRTRNDSKAINSIRGTCIIIAGSGMCTGGRIKHHLARHLPNPANTVLFVGYQAHGTLGRYILEKPETVRVLGETVPVRARIEKINGFSGHAGRTELLNWITALKRPPRAIFATHGEEKVAEAFAALITEKTGWPASAPGYLHTETWA